MRFASWGSAAFTPLEIVEFCLVLLCILTAFLYPALGRNFFARIEQLLRVISKRRWLAALILAVGPIGIRAALLPVYPPPLPYIHDEFAYLLQADTYASGRLANPTPPFPDQFATIYVLMHPTYASEYQVGQGLALAIGQKLTGNPWAGAVISMGVFCAALYWAFLGWLTPVWAFTGAGIVAVEVGILSYWINSYWGGCVPAIGGALALGGLVRVRDGRRAINALISVVGLSIVLNSRPLEGVLLSLLVGAVLLYWTFVTREIGAAAFFRQVVPPIAAVAALTVAFIGYYNYRITGHPTEFPYLLYRTRNYTPQGFFWQKPVIAHSPMPLDVRAEYEDQYRQFTRIKNPVGFVRGLASKARSFWTFYIGIPLTLPLIFLPFIWRRRNMGIVLAALLLIVVLDNMAFFAYFPHYSAAVAVGIFLVVVECLRRMRSRGEAGLFLSRSLPLICLLAVALPICGRCVQGFLPAKSPIIALWATEFGAPLAREVFLPKLLHEPGKQLVMVRYEPEKHNNMDGWVFNTANIDNQKIVWIRESKDPEINREILKRFAGRKVWLGLPDAHPPRLIPYPEPETQQLSAARRGGQRLGAESAVR